MCRKHASEVNDWFKLFLPKGWLRAFWTLDGSVRTNFSRWLNGRCGIWGKSAPGDNVAFGQSLSECSGGDPVGVEGGALGFWWAGDLVGVELGCCLFFVVGVWCGRGECGDGAGVAGRASVCGGVVALVMVELEC